MILGVLLRIVLEFLRRRGVPVPDPSRLRSRKPVIGLTDRVVAAIFPAADDPGRPADPSTETDPEADAARRLPRRRRRSR